MSTAGSYLVGCWSGLITYRLVLTFVFWVSATFSHQSVASRRSAAVAAAATATMAAAAAAAGAATEEGMEVPHRAVAPAVGSVRGRAVVEDSWEEAAPRAGGGGRRHDGGEASS